MKKILALVLALAMALALVACGGSNTGSNGGNSAASNPPASSESTDSQEQGGSDEGVEITLWTYPIGGWGKEDVVSALIADFKNDTGITVKVEYLDYTNGDDTVNTALSANKGPDLIMEGPERLVANWGANGYMVDISDLIDDTDKAEINAAALSACYDASGACYEYPLVMTAHCMAINKTVFEAAGAMQYLNAETHTWNSTEDFFKAIQAVYEYTGSAVGAVFCQGQGGDQGTRALVNNLYGGTFTNPEHTGYTWNSEENVKALQALYDCEGIEFRPDLVGGTEITEFYQGLLNVAFCWNIAQQLNPNTADTGAEKTLSGDDILFMAFPSDDQPELCGGIWGFGIFNNGDQAKIDASKTFIKWMCDSEHTADAVLAANYFAVRDTAEGTDLSGIWADNAIMAEYNKLMPMLGDYYQVTTNWAAARYQWWNMLQQVGNGADIAEVVAEHAGNADAGVAE